MQLRIWGKPKLGRSRPPLLGSANISLKIQPRLFAKFCTDPNIASLRDEAEEQNFVYRKYLATQTFHTNLTFKNETNICKYLATRASQTDPCAMAASWNDLSNVMIMYFNLCN